MERRRGRSTGGAELLTRSTGGADKGGLPVRSALRDASSIASIATGRAATEALASATWEGGSTAAVLAAATGAPATAVGSHSSLVPIGESYGAGAAEEAAAARAG